jgi:predicted MFS family arabinose efflux permease
LKNLNDFIPEFLKGGWVVLLIGAAGMVARLVTTDSTDEISTNSIIKNILSAMITSLLAWFILEQFEINSLYKALIYGLAGLNSPEILKGILKVTTSFSDNPGEFLTNIKSGKINTPAKRNTRTVKKPVRKTTNKK